MPMIHKVSDFKPRAGKIFDAARHTPQYVLRKGDLLVIQRAGVPATPGEVQLEPGELEELNRELEELGRRGSRVVDELRKGRAR